MLAEKSPLEIGKGPFIVMVNLLGTSCWSAGKRCCRFVLCSDLLSPCVLSSVTSPGLPDPVVNDLVTASMSSCAGSPTSSISADADRSAPLCDGAASPSNHS